MDFLKRNKTLISNNPHYLQMDKLHSINIDSEDLEIARSCYENWYFRTIKFSKEALIPFQKLEKLISLGKNVDEFIKEKNSFYR